MRWVAVVVILGGCRFGFSDSIAADDAAGDDIGDVADGPLDDAPIDALPPNAITWSFGERTGSTKTNVTTDTYISNEVGKQMLNFGGTDVLRAEQDVPERILVRFDVSAIPASSSVVAARIVVGISQFDANAQLSVRPVLEQWTENTLDGATGEANYTQRTAAVSWTTAGAGSPGSAGPVIGSVVTFGLVDHVILIDVAVVQGWITNPSTNFGMAFEHSSASSVRFFSSEASNASLRPQLVVSYTP